MPLSTGFRKHLRWRGRESAPTSSQHSLPDRRTSVAKKSQRKKKNLIGHPFSKTGIGAPRWILSESMTDVLTDECFRRIEADEMLKHGPIVVLHKKREAAQRLNEEPMRKPYSIGSVCRVASTKSETDVARFHPHEPASGIRVKQTVEKTSVLAEATSHALDLASVSNLVSQGIPKQDLVAGDDESIPKVNDKIDASPENLLRLPPRDPARLGAKTAQNLPSTPEITVTAADETQIEPLGDVLAFGTTNTKRKEDDKYIYLKSTPYTLTQPSFRHGPITLSQADVGRGVKPMDDTIDWKAFQIAIQGGAGDLFQDMSNEEDEEQVEEIVSWFDTFGFETYGVLVTEDVPELEFEPGPSMRPSSYSTLSPTPSTIDNDNELPIPVGAEFPLGFWNAPAPGQAFEKIKFFNRPGLKRWVGEGGPKRPSFHSSDESLPPSPMMPLMDDGEGALSDKVPMGYNLGHDLGDFCSGRRRTLYASEFSMRP
ncbi:hypothetical protein BFJ70_g17433 [Fusarium oxysporum]|nr:hypothetical protein BFJ70_g17433 [Fusarium oxysporum]